MINILDVLIAIILLIQAHNWFKIGLVRGVLSTGGFWLGMICALILLPMVLPYFEGLLLQISMIILMILLVGLLFSFWGQVIAARLQSVILKLNLSKLNKISGSVFSVFITLIVVWLVAANISGGPFSEVNRQIQNSYVIQSLNRALPPAPGVISRIGNMINPENFPQVFIDREPRPVEPREMPDSEELQAALDAAGESTVRIEAAGCGGLQVGSGFVVADDVVATNAHVIAGIDNPQIVDINGQHRSEVIYFNADMDIALLRSSGLAGNPLPLQTQIVPIGTTAAVLGYPGGGELTVEAASIFQQMNARGRDIYGQSVVTRPIYAKQTSIVTGNSGGPVVLENGEVAAMVFARSVTHTDVGYSITANELQPRLERALDRDSVVSSGRCINR